MPQPTATGDRLAQLRERLFAPVDIASLVYFRIAFGLILALDAVKYLKLGWVREQYIEPTFFFSYPGFGWVTPWPGEGMLIHFALLVPVLLCLAIGFAYRLCALLFFLAYAHFFLIDQVEYQNHLYLLVLMGGLMALVPAHHAFSVDAWLRPKLRSNTAPAWALWLLRFQIGIPYFYGGVAKLGYDWLHGEPMAWRLAQNADFPLIGRFFHEAWMAQAFSIGGCLFDLLMVPALLWRRTRVLAVLAALSFHLTNVFLFDIGVFPWFMIAALPLYFEPDWPRRGWPGRLRVDPATFFPAAPPRHRALVISLLAGYVALQLLVPLRHHLYPGDRSWTGEANQFAWTMKLTRADSMLKLYVTDPRSGETRELEASAHLSREQFRKMSGVPELLQRYAHHVAAEWEREHGVRPEIRARAGRSLNGRRPQWLIDPEVDLAAQPLTIAPRPWILPLEVPLEERFEPGDFLLLHDPAARARTPWAGRPDGTWIEIEEVTSTPGGDERRRRWREQVQSGRKGRVWVAASIERDGRFEPSGAATPAPLGITPENLAVQRTETRKTTVEIGGRFVRCVATTYRLYDWMSGNRETLTLWTTSQLRVPFRNFGTIGGEFALGPDVVRARYWGELGGKVSESEVSVGKLDSPFSLDGRNLDCALESGWVWVEREGVRREAQLERCLSEEVPGHVVLDVLEGSGQRRVRRVVALGPGAAETARREPAAGQGTRNP